MASDTVLFFMNHFIPFITIIILIMCGIIYLSAKSKQHSTFDRFVDKMQIVVGIFVAVGVILTAEVFRRNLEQSSNADTLKIIDRGWKDVNREIFKQYNHCPNFVNSLYYDWQKDINAQKDTQMYANHNNFAKEDDWYAVNYLCVLMFQAVEDFLSMSNFDETGHYVWFSNFLQWCKSPILQNMWMVQKSNYADTTKDLVNLLIDTAKSNNIQNAADLTAVAKQLDTSYDFKKILEKRHASYKV